VNGPGAEGREKRKNAKTQKKQKPRGEGTGGFGGGDTNPPLKRRAGLGRAYGPHAGKAENGRCSRSSGITLGDSTFHS